jgi:hypothetical protein
VSQPKSERGTSRPANREDSPLRALLSAFFRVFLLAALFAGIVLILISALIRSSDGSEYLVDVVRDLGIGLMVSVFVVVFIEWRAGLTLRTEIAKEVLEAVYGRIVPDVVYDQIRDSTFRSDVLRRDWELEIKVLPTEGNEEEYSAARESASSDEVFLIESTVSYQLENLNDNKIAYTVSHGIDLDVPIKSHGIPRFTEVEVDDDSQSLDSDVACELLANHTPYEEEGLALTVDEENQVLFTKMAQLPRAGAVAVRYTLRRAIRAPGVYVLYCATPADGIKIKIDSTKELKFDVRPLHPQGKRIRVVESARRWEFPYGILPWQGFQIVSSPPPTAEPTLTS